MIHARRNGGVAAYNVGIGLSVVLLVGVVIALAAGYVTVGFQAPWRVIATVAAIAAVAVYATVRRRRATRAR